MFRLVTVNCVRRVCGVRMLVSVSWIGYLMDMAGVIKGQKLAAL